MAVRLRGIRDSKWIIGIVLVLMVTGVIKAAVEFGAEDGLGSARPRRSPKWSVSSGTKKATSAPSRVTSAPARATHAPIASAFTSPPRRATTTAASLPRRTTFAPIQKTTTPGPTYPKQVYPPPFYPVQPNPFPIYVPPPPLPAPNNPTIIIIKEATPRPPKTSIFVGTDFGIGSRLVTHKPTTTTTTRRPKTTTEQPWLGVDGGYDRKTWIDFVKNTQMKDIPLSGQWVRIRGGKSMREGYVEILGEGGLWGSVCDVAGRWDLHKANIVCRQLGYRGGAEAAWQGRPIDNTIVQPSQVREVNCGPSAATLLHCNLRRAKDGHPSEIDNGTCYNRTRNVGVRCRQEPNTVCQFGEKTFGNSCYRIVVPPVYTGYRQDFATLGAKAVKACRGSVPRSELVSVTTQAENDFLSDWLQTEYPAVEKVLTSGIGTHSRLGGVKRPSVEWWLWSGKYRDVDYEKWWPGWTTNPTITPVVPPKSMMCIVLQNTFPPSRPRQLKTADYFYWKAYNGTDTSTPIPYICERPADDVGCLTQNQEYTGPANISESGRACLNWNLQEVRNSPIMSGLLLTVPSAVQAVTTYGGNACRRITLDKEPWCFVSPGPGQQPIPEQCLIPVCGLPSSITSYYEAPKKTNNYAPNFNQIPTFIAKPAAPRTETITYSLPEFSYSSNDLSTAIRTLTETRTLTIKEVPSAVASATVVKEIIPKSPIDEELGEIIRKVPKVDTEDFTLLTGTKSVGQNEFWGPKGSAMAPHLQVPMSPPSPSTTVSVDPSGMAPLGLMPPGLTPPPGLETAPGAGTPRVAPDMVRVLSAPFPVFRTRTLVMESHPASLSEVEVIPKTNEESSNVLTEAQSTTEAVSPTRELTEDLPRNDTTEQQSSAPKVTNPPVLSPPALSYPHPANDIITTARSTVTPKPSLYGSPDKINTRYAAGKGKPFDRQLSSSDFVLILNGILPLEEEATTNVADERIGDSESVVGVLTNVTDGEHTESTGDEHTESTGDEHTESTDSGHTEGTGTDDGHTGTTKGGPTEATVVGQTETTTDAATGTTDIPSASTTQLETAETTTELNNEILTGVTVSTFPAETTVAS